ncbi:NAD(P)/FAD-dependent oxidoreductase [Ramlibacter sp. WS9]|uniref:NAD(P)/FAD-dependent oxidoreductase n=1 Tax=Ramlibacter sp. WS9 TaxID=1882741 RepID=UPI00114402CD|nr:NAD(P)/FAD-dependent oxidoreductase [Ramlibacter sp. WS9]ROZ79406.1 NAD(P)/FAD-dependent oxidoreductase [Ramlibacter sp. WS9]
MELDAVVVGGSFAGLSAALQLARARRQIAVIDNGQRRNRFARVSYGFLAQDGRPPDEIHAEAKRQLLSYPAVRWLDGAAHSIHRSGETFEVVTDKGAQRSKRIVLATGVVDQLPDVPGLSERWGKSVFHCPYCHGYELRNGHIGVLAVGPVSIHQAMLLPDWGAVTLFLNDTLTLDSDQEQALVSRGVRIEHARVVRVSGRAVIQLVGQREIELDGIFTVSRTQPASPLAEQLGCEFDHGPLGPFVKTNAQQETTVSGVFACGDVARAAGNIAVAVGDGSIAGAAAHRSLVLEP